MVLERVSDGVLLKYAFLFSNCAGPLGKGLDPVREWLDMVGKREHPKFIAT